MAKQPTTKMSLTERLLKTVQSSGAATIDKSEYFQAKDNILMRIPIMNVAFSGSLKEGYVPGITSWAGPSKHFKTLFCLIQAVAYLEKYPESVLMLYDSEFGSPLKYFKSVGIDPARVIHVPIFTIEQLRTEMANTLEEVKRGDKVFFMIDSIGMLASKKELDDAIAAKEAADMTRAKVLKSMFRIITPHFAAKDIPLAVVNHTYQTLEMFSKTVQGGGTGGVYAPDNIFFLGRQQDATGSGATKELHGYNYVIKVEKSRSVREQSKFTVTVSFSEGLNKYSGMFDLALEANLLAKGEKKGMYVSVDPETGEISEEHGQSWWEENVDFMQKLVESDHFEKWINTEFQLGSSAILASENE